MPITLIVAAGGTGSRFRQGLPKHGSRRRGNANKLLQVLGNQPLLVRTLSQFSKLPDINEVVVTAPAELKSVLVRWQREKKISVTRIVNGGKTRAESVWKGLQASRKNNEWVMVHDGARPFVSPEAVSKLIRFSKAKRVEAAILARKVVPTIKQFDEKRALVHQTLDRRRLCEAETPQLVRRNRLVQAYKTLPKPFEATDEASLVEAAGGEVGVLFHDGWNPKITSYSDLGLAEAWMSHEKTDNFRIGIGRDLHRLVHGRKLYLGGIHVPSDKGALGHSDGDVLLHAIIDAMLGAVGLGDIGEHFSDLKKKYRNIKSEKMLRTILKKISEKGWRPSQVDTVVTLEKPRLGALKKKIRGNIAKMLSLPEDCISIKAKTLEGLGPEGTLQAISSEAIVTMRPL